MRKKSQAAMEFLMTYGWAILVVLVAIGALAYFGVLNQGSFAPTMCTLPTGLSCLDHRVSLNEDGFNDLELRLKNNLGYTIKITKIEISKYSQIADYGVGIPLENGQASSGPITVPDITGKDSEIADAMPKGAKYNLDIIIHYTNTETLLPHEAKGSISGKVD
jgi:hypothetical protein